MLDLMDQDCNAIWINATLQENSLMVDTEHENYLARTMWSVALLLNLAIFLITKFILLKLTVTARSILQNPHNTLFFIDELQKLIATPLSTGIVVYDLVNSKALPFSEIIPNCGIRIPLITNVMFFGGIAIAAMRWIAIRYTQVMAKWGELKIMFAILISWQVALIGHTYLMTVNSHDIYIGRCYQKGESSISYNPGPVVLVACMVEFAIYLSICQHVYKSDIGVRQFISSESYGRRRRKNAFNLFGYTIHFLIELLMMVSGAVLLKNLKIPPKVWLLFTSTVLTISMLLLSKPMKLKWTQLFVFLHEKWRNLASITAPPTLTPIEPFERQ